MVEPLLEAHTEWIDEGDEKRLKWICPECDVDIFKEVRHATIRCPSCERIMQAENYDADSREPDPENPDWKLEKIAERRGLSPDHYKGEEEEASQQSALSW